MTKQKLIQIVGGVGAGKTTLLKNIDLPNNWTILNEPVEENPVLDLFYADPKRWGFTLEILMEQYFYKKLICINNSNVITDYGVPEVFTNVLYDSKFISNIPLFILF